MVYSEPNKKDRGSKTSSNLLLIMFSIKENEIFTLKNKESHKPGALTWRKDIKWAAYGNVGIPCPRPCHMKIRGQARGCSSGPRGLPISVVVAFPVLGLETQANPAFKKKKT